MSETAPAGSTRVIIGNRYSVDLDRPVGSGGMATVYRGVDLQSRRTVALKTLRTEYQQDPSSRQRFRREARAMAFVNHPNLVTIYDLYEEQDGSWVVMELVEGETLKALVHRDGPMSPEEVALILRQLANALGHLHERNLVHLDIKPQNIMVTPSGEVKLIDFGLAQRPGIHTEMQGGMAFGTVAYLAPEQAKGDPVGTETDVYSLGCVVYEMLTGQIPFDVPDGPDQKRELIRAHLEELPPAPSSVRPELELPGWIDDVIGWALMKEPSDRIHDVRRFAGMFRSGLEGASIDDIHRTSVIDPSNHRELAPERRFRIGRRHRHDGGEDDDPVDDGMPELFEDRAGAFERMYRSGGRLARRSRRLRRLIWRLFFVMVLGTLLLGIVLFLRQGPEALFEDVLSIAPGTETAVSVDQLNVRVGPSPNAELLGVIERGTTVRVTGLSETTGEFTYWPVETTINETVTAGWVWDGGLKPNAWTGKLSWMQDIVERGQAIRDSTLDTWDFLAGWAPGYLAPRSSVPD